MPDRPTGNLFDHVRCLVKVSSQYYGLCLGELLSSSQRCNTTTTSRQPVSRRQHSKPPAHHQGTMSPLSRQYPVKTSSPAAVPPISDSVSPNGQGDRQGPSQIPGANASTPKGQPPPPHFLVPHLAHLHSPLRASLPHAGLPHAATLHCTSTGTYHRILPTSS